MTDILASAARFEEWQRQQLGSLFVEADLEHKHHKMRKGVFPFLRATFWRWCEVVFSILPHMQQRANILAIGDTHLENFGTWRDVDGRLVWGANDFDEACLMPWPLDLIRLATSAVLAAGEDADVTEICTAIWEGYGAGLASPSPIVLERDTAWLRTELVLDEDGRKAFWDSFASPAVEIPSSYLAALRAALPADAGDPACFPRQAGAGSLGRPRFVARLDNWRGGPVLREAKAALPSAWTLFHDQPAIASALLDLAQGKFRSPDPCLRLDGGIVVRRLSPSSRKIEADEKGQLLLKGRMLHLMGLEIGNCHAGDGARMDTVRAQVAADQGGWLADDVRAMVEAVIRDQRAFAKSA